MRGTLTRPGYGGAIKDGPIVAGAAAPEPFAGAGRPPSRDASANKVYNGVICWGYIGIMEKKMENTIQGLGFRDILGLYWNNGKENGNYDNGLYRVYIGIII